MKRQAFLETGKPLLKLYKFDLEALTRFRQTTSVIAYRSQFDAFSNRIKGLSESHKHSSLLNGLKEEVRLLVRMFVSQNMNTTFSLAKIQEEFIFNSRKGSKIF